MKIEISKDEFEQAILVATSSHSEVYDSVKPHFIGAYDKIKISRKFIIVQQRKTPRRVPISQIYYIECVKKHLIFHVDGEDVEITANLSDIYSELKDFEFYQVHQGYIVNLKQIHKIDDYMIILTNGDRVPISVRKKTDVITRYADFLEKNL